MADAQIRPATEDDAPFLAWAMLEADRGHTGVSSLDIMLPGPDEKRLAILEHLARKGEGSYSHWSRFLVAEDDSGPLATVASYVPGETLFDRFYACIREATGWTEERLAEAASGAYSRDYFSVPIPSDTWRVEWVATRREARGRGLNRKLLEALLEQGREHGHTTSHVGTYIENEPAIAAYKAAGFEVYAEARHADFERVFRCPGLVFFRRDL